MFKTKDYAISVIRLIALCMIVACHIFQGLGNNLAFYLNIGVQVFFFISGYLYGDKNIKNAKEFYSKRLKKILVPYLITYIICLLLEIFVLHKSYSVTSILANIFGYGAFMNGTSIITHTWFVSYILICYLLVPILDRMFTSSTKENVKRFILLVLFIESTHQFGLINFSSAFINTFIAGYFYKRCCTSKKAKSWFETLSFGLLIIMLPIFVILNENLSVNLPSLIAHKSSDILDYSRALLGISLFIFLYKVFDNLKIRKSTLLDISDEYSYHLYLVHQIFILNSFSLLAVTKFLPINILLIIILTLISGFMLKVISDLIIDIVSKVKR